MAKINDIAILKAAQRAEKEKKPFPELVDGIQVSRNALTQWLKRNEKDFESAAKLVGDRLKAMPQEKLPSQKKTRADLVGTDTDISVTHLGSGMLGGIATVLKLPVVGKDTIGKGETARSVDIYEKQKGGAGVIAYYGEDFILVSKRDSIQGKLALLGIKNTSYGTAKK